MKLSGFCFQVDHGRCSSTAQCIEVTTKQGVHSKTRRSHTSMTRKNRNLHSNMIQKLNLIILKNVLNLFDNKIISISCFLLCEKDSTIQAKLTES